MGCRTLVRQPLYFWKEAKNRIKNADAGLCKMAYNELVKQNILVEMPTIYADDRGL